MSARLTTALDSAPSETAREILMTAARLFAERGYAGTSSRDIAKAVGKTQSLIFHHYATKEKILLALAEFALDEPLALFEAAYAADAAPAVKVYVAVHRHAEYLCVRPLLHKAMLGDSEGIRWRSPAYLRAIRRYMRLSQATLEEGARLGQLEFEDLRLANLAVLGFVNSILNWYAPDYGSPRQVADFFAGRALRMIAAPGLDQAEIRRAAAPLLEVSVHG